MATKSRTIQLPPAVIGGRLLASIRTGCHNLGRNMFKISAERWFLPDSTLYQKAKMASVDIDMQWVFFVPGRQNEKQAKLLHFTSSARIIALHIVLNLHQV
jgi:hypothetical protein